MERDGKYHITAAVIPDDGDDIVLEGIVKVNIGRCRVIIMELGYDFPGAVIPELKALGRRLLGGLFHTDPQKIDGSYMLPGALQNDFFAEQSAGELLQRWLNILHDAVPALKAHPIGIAVQFKDDLLDPEAVLILSASVSPRYMGILKKVMLGSSSYSSSGWHVTLYPSPMVPSSLKRSTVTFPSCHPATNRYRSSLSVDR